MAARFRVRWLAAWRDITKWRVYWLAAWREVVSARRWTKIGTNSYAWKYVYIKSGSSPPPSPPPSSPPPPPPTITLSVTSSPASVSGTRVGAGTVYTNTATVNASKGTPPYTYKFTKSSYSGTVVPSILIGATPNLAQFSRVMSGSVPETETATFKCTVTDAVGNKGSCLINASFYTTAQSGTGGDGTINGQLGGGGIHGQGGSIP